MGVFDKFLDIMKLNDDDYDDDEFYDDDDFADDGDFEEKPRRSFFGKKNNKEESFNDFDADEDKKFQLPARLHQCVLLQNTAETWKYAL